jgi:hypothetical protein
MNAEIIKAMSETKKRERTFKKWWSKNGYKVLRVVLFPIWIASIIKEKIEKKLDEKESWNEERTKEIFDYYVPRKSNWDNEEKEFYFFDNGYGWSIGLAKRYLKRKDFRFWELHNGFCGGKLRDYLIYNYELEGFTKEVIDNCNSRTEIIFKMN